MTTDASGEAPRSPGPRQRPTLAERALDVYLHASSTQSAAWSPRSTNSLPVVSRYLSEEVHRFDWYRKQLYKSTLRARDRTEGVYLHKGDECFPDLDLAFEPTLHDAVTSAKSKGLPVLDVSPAEYDLYQHPDLFEADGCCSPSSQIRCLPISHPLEINGRGNDASGVVLAGNVRFEAGSAGSRLRNITVDSRTDVSGSVHALDLGSTSAVKVQATDVRLEDCELKSSYHGVEITGDGGTFDGNTKF